MELIYLAIENDPVIHARESQYWKSKGVDAIQVSSMTEGIDIASKKRFLYIGINADNVHYTSSLNILREVTNDPIFMATTNYTIQRQTEATKLGADLFGQLGESPEDNYDAVMTQIEYLRWRLALDISPIKPVIYRNLLLSDSHRLALINDRPIDLTRNEFDLLLFLASNRGRVFTFEQLYAKMNDSVTIDRSVSAIIKNTVARIRRKVADLDNSHCIIESVHSFGFKCPVL